jgi:hypothetical protein
MRRKLFFRAPIVVVCLGLVVARAGSPVPPQNVIVLDSTVADRETIPVPGLYKAEPYAMLVYVPPTIDPRIVVNPPMEKEATGRVVKPSLRLVPWRP